MTIFTVRFFLFVILPLLFTLAQIWLDKAGSESLRLF
jgi:hypothetical protein